MRLRQRIRSALGLSGVAADHEVGGTREGLGEG